MKIFRFEGVPVGFEKFGRESRCDSVLSPKSWGVSSSGPGRPAVPRETWVRIRLPLPFSGGSSSAKLLELRVPSLVLSGLVPIRTLALWTDARLTVSGLSGNPLVRAAATSVAGTLDRDRWHRASNILRKDTVSTKF